MATWNFVVSDSYAEKVGADGVERLLGVLAAGAENAPGRSPKELQAVLAEAAERLGIGIPAPELHSMAGNLSLHDLEAVVVTDDSGAELRRIPIANDASRIPAEERSENVHLEPGDPRRPTIS